ncbi:uncharacterized protein MAM_08080 [Metarhizium album ARSEF 1941]|uniref:Glycosyl transferase, family 25 n=1 Tax=Metarhizium album (strain ARSEF 1941) TaxID=1081103 RepID=A0A0B2WDW7_METAS|nr:uncharacterized protein MAM_08080 [Metarhizium album ARSEF 1941]KHN94071.1 hypothetical protein MAM_08080 [Metarhizium album ARSEF 1941]
MTLFTLVTRPVADRSALWLPSTRTDRRNGTTAADPENYPPGITLLDNDAGNSTLGFSSIYLVYIAGRYDRLDAMALQSYLSGVDLTEYAAVGPELIKDVGMPPTRKPGKLRKGEKGCWRAHANVWSATLRHRLPPVLIVESDATWDINRAGIFSGLLALFTRNKAWLNVEASASVWTTKAYHQDVAQARDLQQHPVRNTLLRR